ncbi:MAG: hypothetical protein HOP19_26800 [Acidobacteria bacterium]|nr:hypothetical protein [Acidobacteriota bacterium]
MDDIFYKRNLPHWQPPGANIFLTWNLDGALPKAARERLIENRKLLEREIARAEETQEARMLRHYKQQFAVYDAILDKAEEGPLWLKEKAIADLVQETLLSKYAELYTLWAYVVMANHVHVLLQPKVLSEKTDKAGLTDKDYVKLSKITQSLKGYSSLEANKILQRTGKTFWQTESYDHWSRDAAEFNRIVKYVENNPVKAGLVEKPEDWCWSSAAERQRRGLEKISALT